MFKETFYWLYQYWYKRNPNDQPYYNAFLGVLLFQSLNIITIGAIVRKFGYKLHYDKSISIFAALIALVVLTLVDFRLLYLKKEQIVRDIDTYSAKDLSKSKNLYRLYVVLSLILCFGLLIYSD